MQVKRGKKFYQKSSNPGDASKVLAGNGTWVSKLDGDLIWSAKSSGAKGDGVTPDSTALQTAINNAPTDSIFQFPSGRYRLTSKLTLKPGMNVDARQATFVCEALDNAITAYSPTADRTPATTYPLTINTVESEKTVTVSTGSAALLAAGQMVMIRDTTTVGSEQVHREMNIIKSVNLGTGVVTLVYRLNFAYTTANSAWIGPVVPASRVKWRGGEFDMAAVPSNPGSADRNAIYICWGLHCEVSDVTVRNHPNKGIDLYGSIDCRIKNPVTEDASAMGPGEGYGPRLTYCRNSVISNAWSRNVRHGADVTGGSDCQLKGITTNDSITGPFLHGCRSKRITLTDINSVNCEQGFIAGNGTFDWDKDFTLSGYNFFGCDTGIFLMNGCSGFSVDAGIIKNSLVRAIVCQAVSNGKISNADCDGVLTNPSNYGVIDISSGSDDLRFENVKATCPAAGYNAIRVTGAGRFRFKGVEIDHTGSNAAWNFTSFTGTAEINGGALVNRTTNDSLILNGAASSYVDGLLVRGLGATPASGIRCTGGALAHVVRGCSIIGIGEGVRSENTGSVIPEISKNYFESCTTAIRLVATMTAARVFDNTFIGTVSNKLVNSPTAKIYGNVAASGGVSVDRGDANATLTLGSDEEVQRYDTTLTANRTVTLATTAAAIVQAGRFRVVRTGLGAFTLDVGGLKSIPASTAAWVEVIYSAGAWKLAGYGTL